MASIMTLKGFNQVVGHSSGLASTLRKSYLFIILSFMLAGCVGDKTLCGGYVITYVNGCEVRIHNPNLDEQGFNGVRKTFKSGCDAGRQAENRYLFSTMINGNIESYAVNEPYITGSTSTNCLDLKLDGACEGYFLLDTRAHDLTVGMSKEEWELKLQEINWNNPRLVKLRKSS